MKVVLAPDSFKGSLTATQVCHALTEGLLSTRPDLEILRVPVSDGGDGFLESIHEATPIEILEAEVQGPGDGKVKARWGITDEGTAIIEMAQAAGIILTPEKDQLPLQATTYGVGELLMLAINRGATQIIIGLGGSATTDGGHGALAAMGFKFLDSTQRPIPAGNEGLAHLAEIEIPKNIPWANIRFTIASDVSNPLTGRHGSAIVYGPQKGASREEVSIMETNLCHYSEVVRKAVGRDPNSIVGAGAAGGLGAAIAIFLNGRTRPGFDVFNDLTDLETKVQHADVVITGEGKLDHQTLDFGKAPIRIRHLCEKHGKKCFAVGGLVEEKHQGTLEENFDAVFAITHDRTRTAWAIKNAAAELEKIGKRIGERL